MDSLKDHLARLNDVYQNDLDLDFRYQSLDLPEEESSLAKSLVNEASYIGRKLCTDQRVPGRIGDKQFYPFWEKVLKAPEFVLKTISEGYRFPFTQEPPASYCKNNSSFLKNRDFGIAELDRLEALGCISRIDHKPYITLPLSVVFSKKLRLVVDCSRTLNPFIKDQKVKLESLDICEQQITQNDFQTTSDLDSGYWHIPLAEDQKRYVGVHVILDNGEIRYYAYGMFYF